MSSEFDLLKKFPHISHLCQNGVHALPETLVVPDRHTDACHLLIIQNIFVLVQVKIKARECQECRWKFTFYTFDTCKLC